MLHVMYEGLCCHHAQKCSTNQSLYVCVGYSNCLVASCHAVLPIVPVTYEGPS